jgi:hypothetical protein
MGNRQRICGGYTKRDLVALLLSGDPMTFYLGDYPDKENSIKGRLNSMAIEDGSRNNWLLSGYTEDGEKFKAFFDTKHSAGWIELIS